MFAGFLAFTDSHAETSVISGQPPLHKTSRHTSPRTMQAITHTIHPQHRHQHLKVSTHLISVISITSPIHRQRLAHASLGQPIAWSLPNPPSTSNVPPRETRAVWGQRLAKSACRSDLAILNVTLYLGLHSLPSVILSHAIRAPKPRTESLPKPSLHAR